VVAINLVEGEEFAGNMLFVVEGIGNAVRWKVREWLKGKQVRSGGRTCPKRETQIWEPQYWCGSLRNSFGSLYVQRLE
jgi:hypothetical protein